MTSPPSLRLGAGVLRRLTRLRLEARVSPSSVSGGTRQGMRPGSSREFFGFRAYEVGDDVRDMDWAATLRLDRPYVRVYRREVEASLLLLIDASRSMAFGEPSKLGYAQALASALGYLALAHHDRVGAAVFGNGDVTCLPLSRGEGHWAALERFVGGARAAGGSGLDGVLTAVRRCGQPGLTVLISDLLPPETFRNALRRLALCPTTVVVIQLLSPQEIDPDVQGDLELVDLESGEARRGFVGDAERREYRAALADLRERAAAMCRRAGIRHVALSTAAPLVGCLQRDLVRAGVLRRERS
jgi:uncharacterized protein (DUF58 family)